MRIVPQSFFLPLLLCALAGSVAAHDDDPKILDRQAPYVGPGYRPGTWISAASGGISAIGAQGIGGSQSLTNLSDDHMVFDSSGVELLSWLPLKELDSSAFSGNDCWGYVSPSGREYAIMGLSRGTAFVEISLPSDPVVVGHITGPQSLWRDVKVYGSHAYIVSEGGGGIQVIDLGGIDSGVVNQVNTVNTGGVSSTHNVAIDEDSGFLYRCGGSTGQGIRVYSLSNPANPSYVGAWNGRYVHDVQVVTYTSGPYSGRQIAFACGGFGNGSNQTGLSILDVTNKNNITVRAMLQYPGAAYSHQACLSPDRQLLYLDDELDETGTLTTTTHVIDVSDIDSPVVAGTFSNDRKAIGHNLYTLGDQIFEANYRSGLRIFETSVSPLATEVAFFDTYPANDSAHFNGMWSCYPYFPSGTVIGSDMERGLFVLWVGDPKLTLELVGLPPTTLSPDGGTVDLRINQDSPGDLQAGTERLYYDVGGGLVEAPLTPLGGDLFQASFPSLPCLSEVRWFVGARSQDGILWTYPKEAPYNNLDALVAYGEAIAFADDMEIDRGWTVGAPDDDANAGMWERTTPVPEAAAPEEDHSPSGTACWVTEVGNDVDGGRTTLNSPIIDLTGWSDPVLDFWLWFETRNFPTPLDNCRIEVRSGAGEWVLLERVEGATLTESSNWRHRQFRLADWITLGPDVQVRFRARDAEFDSRVEVAVDDFKISEGVCSCASTNYCVAQQNSVGLSAQIYSTGTSQIAQNDFVLGASGAVPGNLGLFFYGPLRTQLPLAEGTLCVGGGAVGIQRPTASGDHRCPWLRHSAGRLHELAVVASGGGYHRRLDLGLPVLVPRPRGGGRVARTSRMGSK